MEVASSRFAVDGNVSFYAAVAEPFSRFDSEAWL
jgi:hypothetical protein